MNIALVTLLDDNFVIAFEGFWKSFIYHNDWFDYDFVILDLGLSEENKKKMLGYYDKIKFYKVNKEAYKETNFNRTVPHLQNTFYTFEFFKLDYDKVVFMDMDLTILADIKELFECEEGFAACKAYSAPQDRIIDTMFNSGVFVVQRKYLTMEMYNKAIRRSRIGCSMPDQRILNNLFMDKVFYLPKEYNIEKRMYKSEKHQETFKDAKVLHWVAGKPWQKEKKECDQGFEELEQIWWEYYDKH